MRATPGQSISNAAVISIGVNGGISAYVSQGNTNITVDVQGYFTAGARPDGGRFVPVDANRVLDTRTGLGQTAAHTLSPFETIDVQIGGTSQVTPSTPLAAFVNVTTISPSAAGGVMVYASDKSRPTTDAINYGINTQAGAMIVAVGGDGKVKLYNDSSHAQNFALDIQGYFTPEVAVATDDGSFTVARGRAYDSRLDQVAGQLGPNEQRDIVVGGQFGIPPWTMPTVLVNVGVMNATVGSYVNVWSESADEPATSTVNYVSGTSATRSLTAITLSSEGKISLKNHSAVTSIDFTIDLQGWFSPPSEDITDKHYVTVTSGTSLTNAVVQAQVAGAVVQEVTATAATATDEYTVGYEVQPEDSGSVATAAQAAIQATVASDQATEAQSHASQVSWQDRQGVAASLGSSATSDLNELTAIDAGRSGSAAVTPTPSGLMASVTNGAYSQLTETVLGGNGTLLGSLGAVVDAGVRPTDTQSAADPCNDNYWTPLQSSVNTYQSSGSRRAIRNDVRWGTAGMANLKNCFTGRQGIELDLIEYNYANQGKYHYLGWKISSWSTNIPKSYLDTRFGDNTDPNRVGPKEVSYAVGASRVSALKANTWYHISMLTKTYTKSSGKAKFWGSIVKDPTNTSWCANNPKWCMFETGARTRIFNAWTVPLPGYKSNY